MVQSSITVNLLLTNVAIL